MQYIRNLIAAHKIEATEDGDPKNHSKQYLIPVSALDPVLQAKYYGKSTKRAKAVPAADPRPLDSFSAAERAEVDLWIDIVKDWLAYRSGKDKAEADAEYLRMLHDRRPELNIMSIDTIYRRWKAWRDQNWAALTDQRGKWKKGQSSIDEIIWQAFLSFYLDEAQHPIECCYKYTRMWAKKKHPELLPGIPSYYAFRRRIISDLPEPVRVLGREGQKAYDDRCAPYIRRLYDDMESNDYWVGDNHTFDVITDGPNGKTHRLYLTSFFDARSGIFTGFTVTDNPCSDATLYALRKGIVKYGIPRNVYVDNGHEFLNFDVGGLGHRKRKSAEGVAEPPGVFKRLGITMINAEVRNAKAKIIERRHLDIKNQLSRLFSTFTGGNVVEKPERLKDVLKSGNIPTDHELIQSVETLLEYYFNEQTYGGSVAADRGKSRIEVYQNHLRTKCVASEDDLNLMMMRSSRPQKVGRTGVHLDIAGFRLDYWDKELLCSTYFGKQVYFRYDPEQLTKVRLYDLEDRYIMTVPVSDETVSRYGASRDEIKAAKQRVGKAKKAVKLAMQESMLASCDRISALDLVLADAQGKKAAMLAEPIAAYPLLEIQHVDEQPLLQAVNGDINLDTMGRNAKRHQNRTSKREE